MASDLFAEFKHPSFQTWKEEVTRLLNNTPFEKTMITESLEGIRYQALYRAEDVCDIKFKEAYPGCFPQVRGSELLIDSNQPWWVAQEIVSPQVDDFNRQLTEGLNAGLNAVNMRLDSASRQGLDPDQASAPDVGDDGVSIACLADMERALRTVNLAETPIIIQTGASGMPYLGLLVALARKNGVAAHRLQGAIATDPLGELANRGSLPKALVWSYLSMAEMTAWATDHAPKLGTIWVRGDIYGEAGAHAVQEIAYALGTGLEYLRQMESRGLTPNISAAHLRFSFSLGTEFFMEVAKLRAARLLWARILEACGVPEAKRGMVLHGKSNRFFMSRYDPYVNLLRATTQAFSAICGGAGSLHLTEFDKVHGASTAFSRRLARNIQLILKEECHLQWVTDPGGGAYAIEGLTHELAQAAWCEFQNLEKRGGMTPILQDGTARQAIQDTVKLRRKNLATRKTVMVGLNQYPNPSERLATTEPFNQLAFFEVRARQMQSIRTSSSHSQEMKCLQKLADLLNADASRIAEAVVSAAQHGATVGEIVRTRGAQLGGGPEVEPLSRERLAEPFERLRHAVEEARSRDIPCRVFIATLGPVARYMPRLDFAASFFEVGGFDTIRTSGHATPEQAVESAKACDPCAVVLCAPDATYADQGVALAASLKQALPGATLYLAGHPKDESLKRALQEAGVKRFIYIKTDILETLEELAQWQGVK